MKKIRHIITDIEKEILTKFFLHQKINSRKNYIEWLDKFFTDYGVVKPEESTKSIYSMDYNIEMIWDNFNNTSLIQHFVKNTKYRHSNSSLTNFKKFHSDFNHLDNNGSNILHYAAKDNYKCLQQLLKDETINKLAINNDGKTYHMIFIENFKNTDLIPSKSSYFSDITNRLSLISHILVDFTENNIQDIIEPKILYDFIGKNEKIFIFIEKIADIPNLNSHFYNEYIENLYKFKNQLMFVKFSRKFKEKSFSHYSIKI